MGTVLTVKQVAFSNGTTAPVKTRWTTHGGLGMQTILPQNDNKGQLIVGGLIQAGSASATYTPYANEDGTLRQLDGIRSLAARESREIDPSQFGWLSVGLAKSFDLDLTSASLVSIMLAYVEVPSGLTPEPQTPGSLSFTPNTASFPGSAGSVTVPVTRNNGSDNAGGYHVASVNGTAVAGVDFTAVSANQTLADGQTSDTVTVTLLGAALVATKTFTLVLSAPYGGITLSGDATCTVSLTVP